MNPSVTRRAMYTVSSFGAILATLLALPDVAFAQNQKLPDPPPAAPAAQPAAATPTTPDAPGGDRLTPSELEELLGAIALYPDSLLANVLAASVYPNEVAEAAAAVKSGANAAAIDAKAWEDPVKTIAKIPDAIKMMGEFPEWTVALGQAYIVQSKDVMDTVQRLREKAKSTGALQTSPQQEVTVAPGTQTIVIEQSNPEVVYVPSYNPSVVYVDDDDDELAAGLIGFGVGVAMTSIAWGIGCNWGGGCVGWGGNDVDIDIDRNTNINNIGNNNNIGNKVGQQGNRWSPNSAKTGSTARTDGLKNFKSNSGAGARAATPGGGNRAAASTRSGAAARPSTAARTPANRSGSPAASPRVPAARPSAPASGRSGNLPASRPAAANRPAPSAQRGGSAFQGGNSTRAASSRGSASRGAARGGGGGGRGGGRR